MGIVSLIQSLTPTEKQLFKKLCPARSEYVLLFDYVNRNKNFEIEKIQRYLARKSGKERTHYTSGYLSVLKSYLKDRILDSLRLNLIGKRSSYEIMIRSVNAEILLEKGLIEMAGKELAIARKKGGEGLFPIENLVILRRESIQNVYQNYKGFTLESLQLLLNKQQKLVKQLEIEAQFVGFLSLIGFCQVNNLDPGEYITTFKTHKYYRRDSPPDQYGFENQYLFYWTKGLVAEHENRKEDAINLFRQAVQVWLDNPQFIEIHTRMYLGICFNYLNILQKFATPRELDDQTRFFQLLIEKLKKISLSTDEKQRLQLISLLFEFYAFKTKGDFQPMIAAMPRVMKILRFGDLIVKPSKITLRYYLAFAFFRLERFDKALDWLQPIFENLSKSIKSNPDYYTECITIYLLVHFYLGNYRFLQYELKKKTRLLKKYGQWKEAHEKIFKMLSKMIQKPFSTEQHIENMEHVGRDYSLEIEAAINPTF